MNQNTAHNLLDFSDLYDNKRILFQKLFTLLFNWSKMKDAVNYTVGWNQAPKSNKKFRLIVFDSLYTVKSILPEFDSNSSTWSRETFSEKVDPNAD